MRSPAAALVGLGAVIVAACNDAVAPEARVPIVDGIYNVDTQILSNSCAGILVLDGSAIFAFTQNGRTIEFRPPAFDEQGKPTLLDLGITGEVDSDGRFSVSGTYRLAGNTIVAFTMEGRFDDNSVEGVQHQVASFSGGSFCEVTFSFQGVEV